MSLTTILAFFLLGTAAPALAATQSLTPMYNGGDGVYVQTLINGQNVWQQAQAGSGFLYFNVPAAFTTGNPLYVQITYYDASSGRLSLQYDSTNNAFASAELHTRSSCVGSGQFVSSYQALLIPKFAARENGGADFRIGGYPPIRSVVISDVPFTDSNFQLVLSKPWLQPYSGPTTNLVDASTLRGKLVAGYQGWFGTPNDLNDGGWIHWCQNGTMVPENFNTDMWPDMTQYPTNTWVRAGAVQTKSGLPAYLFSSTSPEVVNVHFQWMRKYNIDGAFVQRFLDPNFLSPDGHPEWVLANVRAAANREGRIWAIEYDVSGLNSNNVYNALTRDWKWLVDTFHILQDPRYCHEGTKPVVVIWGLPIRDTISVSAADQVVDFFHNDPIYGGNYVLGGIGNSWGGQTNWTTHIKKYDGLQVWQSQNYATDNTTFTNWGKDCYPHVWPGGGWANMNHLSADSGDFAARNGGVFFWNKLSQVIGVGAKGIFVGMFDEYDESTAIMPMSDDPPNPPPNWGRFITNGGKPSEWWLALAGYAKEMMLGQKTFTTSVPSLYYKYYTGTWSSLPDFSSLTPAGAGAVTNVSLGAFSNADTNNFAYVFQGILNLPADGTYTFFTTSDEGSKLLIDSTLVVNNDGIHGMVEASGSIVLKAGPHPIEVQYFQQSGAQGLQVRYQSSTIIKQLIPSSALYPVGTKKLIAGKTFAIKSQANGKFVSADSAGVSPLIAKSTTIGPWEQFRVLDAGNGRIGLQCVGNSLDVWVDNLGTSRLIAKSASLGARETFTEVDDGVEPYSRVYFTALANSKYVWASNGGSDPLSANSGNLGSWESFIVQMIPDSVAAPDAPSALTATAASGSQISLSWTDHATNEEFFKIERKAGSEGVYSQVATAPANAAGYIDSVAASNTYYYRVRAANVGGDSPFSNEARTQGVLPSPWSNQDLGSVGLSGSSTYTNGIFTLTGSGADIWNTADGFQFMYQTGNGDCEVTAKVMSVGNVDAWSKAGVMIRETLDAGARNVALVMTPGNGASFQYRTNAGGACVNTTSGGKTAPCWVKLVRTGNVFKGYIAADGAAWTQVGATLTNNMASIVYIGLAVTSHNNTSLTTATFSDVTPSMPPVQWSMAGQFTAFTAVPQSQTCVLESTANLPGGWAAVATNTALTNGVLFLTDGAIMTNQNRFYRLRYD